VKRYTGKYSFNTRKQSYRKKHQAKGVGVFSGSFLGRLAEVFKADLQRSIAILTAAAVIIAAVLVICFAGPVAEASSNSPVPSKNAATVETQGDEDIVIEDPADTRPEDYNAVSTDAVDDDILAGLTGEDGGIDDTSGDYSDAELKGAIGVVFDNVNTAGETAILQKIEEASAAAIKDGKIGTVKFYNSKGDLNQQLQDMRSMVNINAKAVILAVTDKETFVMLAGMAKTAGIPVIAINAPVNEGYAVNIVEDASAWGQKTADYLKQKLLSGNYVAVTNSKPDDMEKQRLNMLSSTLSANTALKSAASITPSNKQGSIKTALSPVIKDNPQIDAVISGQGMGKNVLNACLSFGTVPKIYIGDATAGCIKLWYQLKTTGVEIEKAAPSPTGTAKPAKSAAPKTEKVTLKAQAGEVFGAESLPYGIGGTAFQFALRLGEGKKLKSTVSSTYKYSSTFLITGDNIDQYYANVKDRPDNYVICDWISDADADAMFE